MANINEDLQKIMDAVKGEEVRESIHNAIKDINDQTESILATVEAEVEDIVDEAIDNTALLFTYNPRTYGDSDIHLANAMTYADIFAKPLINLQWVVYAGTTALCNASFECFGKREAGNVTQNLGHLYFNNTYTGSIIDVAIPNGGENMYDTFSYTEISTGGGGTTYTAGDNIDIINNVISADIVEQLVTFSMSPTGSTPAYSVTCNKSFSDISALVTAHKFKAVLEVVFNNGITRYLPLTQYKFGGGTTYKFYFEYEEDSTITSYIITKDYTQQTDVYTYEIVTTTYQAPLTPGTGIDITNNVISIDLQNAEDNSF